MSIRTYGAGNEEWKPAPNVDRLTLMANRIRILAFSCKSREVFSCEFGNEFAPKVEDYLRECFGEEL